MSMYDDFSKDGPTENRIGERYEKIRIPLYKQKEVYYILIAIIVLMTIIFFTLYTPKIEVPKFIGEKYSTAESWAEANDVKYERVNEFSEAVDSGVVILQSVDAGENMALDTKLVLVVSKGPDPDVKVEIPEFTDMTFEEAKTWADDNYLVNTKIKEEYSDTVESGKYIELILDDNFNKDDFTRKDNLEVKFSKGIEPEESTVVMSDFVGKTKAEAVLWCENNNINVKTRESFSDTFPIGTIISQNVDKGVSVERDSSITIEVSKGPSATVPNVLGFEESTALDKMTKAGLTAVSKYSYNNKVATGKIITQSVRAGQRVKVGESVIVTVSLGKIPLSNPVGVTYDVFYTMINDFNKQGANLQISITYVDHKDYPSAEKGTIVYSSHKNTVLNVGTKLTIHVVE